MNKQEAIDRLCREAVYLVAPLYADSVARAFDATLDSLGVPIRPVTELSAKLLPPGAEGSVRVKHAHHDDKAVWMHELAARLGVHFGLYANMDHAMQSPHHKVASECRYIGHRAAIRLARFFWGEQGVTDLHERNPYIDPKLFAERVYRAS